MLLALALATIVGIVAYGFALSMRQAGTAAKGQIVSEMADSAARMGAQHALEVVMAEYAADPAGVTSPAGRHFTDFADHDHFNLAWDNPSPQSWQSGGTFEQDDDDLHSEAKLFFIHHTWHGGQGKGLGYTAEGFSWPNDGRQTSMLAIGMGRYIEPGYRNSNGTLKPVRFSAVPASQPDYNHPAWFDENFRPVDSRAKARFRVRYAVNAMDLGGHLIYGSQSPFDAATAPTEWDKPLAVEYSRSFYNMVSGQSMNDSGGNPVRPEMMTMFLGYGTGFAHQREHVPARFLAGFTDTGAPLPFQDIEGIVSKPVAMSGELSSCATGGPISWSNAHDMHNVVGSAGGWATRWVFSPYGRATELTSTGSAYYQSSRTNCPWRINALTAPASTIRTMLYAYIPPEITKPVAYQRHHYAWTGTTNPAWPGLPQNTWEGNPYLTVSLNPRQPGGAFGPGLDLHTEDFSPAYLGGIAPFQGFVSADYEAVPTTFENCYPANPEYWENYASYVAPGRDTHDRGILRKSMLGSDIDIFDSHAGDGALNARSWWPIAPGCQAAFGGDSWVYGSGEPREPIRGMCGPLFATYQFYSWQDNIGGDKIRWDLDGGEGFFHRDSYWLDLASAAAGAIVLGKSLYLDAASCGAASYRLATDAPPARPTTVRDLDRLFLAILGEYFPGDTIAPGSSATPKPGHVSVRIGGGDDHLRPGARVAIVDNTASNNIRGVLGLLTADGVANADLKCANMERVLNDWRMSFFGANPTYADFAPLDFDGDGKAIASCYANPVVVLGQSLPGSPALDGVAEQPPSYHWSLTGYFVMERGRFWRVLTRGEVFDERLKKPIAESNYESVFTIDPDGNYNGTTGLGDSSMLYQRWIGNNYRGFQPMTR